MTRSTWPRRPAISPAFLSLFLFESIDQLDGGEEAGTLLVMLDGLHAKRGGDVRLAGTRRKLVDQINQVEEPAARTAANDRGCHANAEMRFSAAGRSSVIVPGVWDQKCGSRIRIIHDAARRWRWWAASGTRAQATSLFASLTGRCLCSQVG